LTTLAVSGQQQQLTNWTQGGMAKEIFWCKRIVHQHKMEEEESNNQFQQVDFSAIL
jgi:hypothetical protein